MINSISNKERKKQKARCSFRGDDDVDLDIDPTGGDMAAAQTEWQQFVKCLQGDEASKRPSATIVRRILGMLYRNKQLDRKITELRTSVTDLITFTNNKWELCVSGPGHYTAIQAADLRLDAIQIQKAADEIYTTCQRTRESDPGAEWAVELCLPRDLRKEAIIKDMINERRVIFGVRGAKNEGPQAISEVRMTNLRLLPASSSTLMLQSAMDQIQRSQKAIIKMEGIGHFELRRGSAASLQTRTWRYILTKTKDDESAKKALSLERAKLAFGMVMWMIYLWKTKWFSNLCTCGFKCVAFDTRGVRKLSPKPESGVARIQNNGVSTSREPAVSTLRLEHIFRPYPSTTQTCPCRPGLSKSGKIFFLGTTLAELLLSEPIDIDIIDGRLIPSATSRFENELDVCYALEEREGPEREMFTVVRFCFEKAQDKQWTVDEEMFPEDQVQALIINVLEP
ncbi:hypothetical protein Asppvi_005652 [Aspergillus pseudoviridinutans]|uniref:Uncharacterized protein n=1 Tax=Aspergillus pseudoviridinutans TaxID=1517512 RepID=A0A9P3B8N8_9EURO|nr:uncharacterized protein Asppvi_005652 [Aspergillus pseudoviridinutans]GIJ86757.1 hypothetical protein Asppvi_005652 [Aspergillus pseudoviridinutans]